MANAIRRFGLMAHLAVVGGKRAAVGGFDRTPDVILRTTEFE
jgi:hypothetical protein